MAEMAQGIVKQPKSIGLSTSFGGDLFDSHSTGSLRAPTLQLLKVISTHLMTPSMSQNKAKLGRQRHENDLRQSCSYILLCHDAPKTASCR